MFLREKGVFNPHRRLDPIWDTKIDNYKEKQEEEFKKEIKTLYDTWDTSKTEKKQQKKEETVKEKKPKKKLGPIYFGIN